MIFCMSVLLGRCVVHRVLASPPHNTNRIRAHEHPIAVPAADAQRAHGYLLRIQSDIESDLKAIERREAYWKRVVDYGHAAISYAEEGELNQGSRWQTVLAF